MERSGSGRPAGLSGHGDPVRIPAELGDVVLHPLAGLPHIVESVVAGGPAALGRQIGMGEESQKSQTVVDGDDDRVLPPGKAGSVAHHLAAAARHHAAAVNPDEYRQLVLRGFRRGPYVQIQAVLLILRGSQKLGNAMHVGGHFRHLHHLLDGCGGILGGPAHAPPAAGILRAAEPQRADGRRGIRDSLVYLQLSLRITLKPSLRHTDLCVFKISHSCDLLNSRIDNQI